MSVLKEYECFGHGPFESYEDNPRCPFGCSTVERRFYTPPAFKSERTANIDRTAAGVAKAYGLTDVNNRDGQAAIRQSGANEAKQAEFMAMLHQRYGDGWGSVPAGGSMNTKTKEVVGSGSGAVGALAQYGARPDNVLEEVRPALVPQPVVVRKDHENLRVRL